MNNKIKILLTFLILTCFCVPFAISASQKEGFIRKSDIDNQDEDKFNYDPSGKRDPFVKYDASSKNKQQVRGDTPLEQVDIKSLKLTAIMSVDNDPRAVIENSEGKGFFVQRGTKIGLNGGVISEILENKIIISETKIDFTGQETVTTIEMSLGDKK